MKMYLMTIVGFAVLAISLFGLQGTALARTDSPNEENPNTGTNGEVRVCGDPNDDCSQFVETYINPTITLLTLIIGVGAAISLVVAGIQYSSSADDPNAVGKAKTRIFKTIIGLIAYTFLYAFIQYMIPGGILGTVV